MRFAFSKSFLVPALAAAALAIPTAHAETINVPFEFTALGHSFPSGAYTVEQNSDEHLVTLHQLKGDAVLNWNVGAGAESQQGHVLLNFGQSEDGMHVLKAVQYGRRFTFEGRGAPARARLSRAYAPVAVSEQQRAGGQPAR